MNKQNVSIKSIVTKKIDNKIACWAKDNPNIFNLTEFLNKEFKIYCTIEESIVKDFNRDSSNTNGYAEAICKPNNDFECAIILRSCFKSKIPITIAAGRTNLTGSATPNSGIILSTEKMTEPKIIVDIKSKTVKTPVGIFLEDMRKSVLRQSNNKLYYPVDPTSRKEAMIGGTLSCNASGFIPGPAGATRFWVNKLEFLTPNGYKIICTKGEFISNNGKFIFNYPDKSIDVNIPTYKQPNIKNASGPFSNECGKIDLIDFIIGSEGIFGLITSATLRLKKMPNEFLDLFFTLPSEKNAINFHQYIVNHYNGDLSHITALEYFGYNCQSYMKNKNQLFNSSSEVGIYLQIPLYNKTIEDVAEYWFDFLIKSNCEINENYIKILNTEQDWNTFFQARHSIPKNALDKTRKWDTCSIITDTIVPHHNFSKYLDEIHSLLKNSEIEYLLFGHLGDCHLHFHLIPTKDQQSQALDIYEKIIEKSTDLGGIYSAEHGTGKRKQSDFLKCFGEDAVSQIQNIKSTLDVDFILNRGNVIKPIKINS